MWFFTKIENIEETVTKVSISKAVSIFYMKNEVMSVTKVCLQNLPIQGWDSGNDTKWQEVFVG